MCQVKGIVDHSTLFYIIFEHGLTRCSGVMETFGVGPSKAALGLSLYVIGCKLYAGLAGRYMS